MTVTGAILLQAALSFLGFGMSAASVDPKRRATRARSNSVEGSQAVALELYMVGVIVEDMPRAIEFYRRLGVQIPEDSDELEHVEVKMSGLTFFLNTRRSNARWDPTVREEPSGGYRIILEFYLETADAVDAKYKELVAFGYEGPCAPYNVTPELRFATVNDPDGNTILLSASVMESTEENA